MDKFSYLFLNVIFYTPVFFILYRKRKVVLRRKGIILGALVLGIFYSFIADSFAVSWGAWTHYDGKILGIKFIGGGIFEELIWFTLTWVVTAAFVIFCSEKEEKGKSPFKL